MTVRELIEKLQQYPPESNVIAGAKVLSDATYPEPTHVQFYDGTVKILTAVIDADDVGYSASRWFVYDSKLMQHIPI